MTSKHTRGEGRMPLPFVGEGRRLPWHVAFVLYGAAHLLLPRASKKMVAGKLLPVLATDLEDFHLWQKQLDSVQN
jgi:hypothetical protein